MLTNTKQWLGEDISSFQTYVTETEFTRIMITSSGQPLGYSRSSSLGQIAVVEPIREGDDFDVLLKMPVLDAGMGVVEKRPVEMISTWDFD